MRKFFAIIFVSLFSLATFAGVGLWQLTDEEHYTAPDNESFMSLQAEFPQHFGSVDGTSVTSATLDLYSYEFTGPTMCQAGDPRLFVDLVAKSICFKDGTCMATSAPMPAPVDPCM